MNKKLFTLGFALLMCGGASAQTPIVSGGESDSKIIVTSADESDMTAAKLMQRFVGEVSGVELEIVSSKRDNKKPAAGDIVIGNGYTNQKFVSDRATEDGFRIVSKDGVVRVVSGGDKGAIYGVVTLLERYLGVKYWGENEYDFTPLKDVVIPELDFVENPALRHRQSQFYGMATDPTYKLWMRLETSDEVFAANYWVHTFDRLMPSAKYGESHPEYYSFFGGRRHPGKASQWCLTNPEVLEIVTAQLDSIFKADPSKHIISVSQNDGNYTNCQCPECKAIDEHEGALSGSVIHFLNKLAARFPDKEISTLAYLYTMDPPKHVKPLPNVNIMLCDIDCNREVTLTENASGQQFVKAMEGWSAITNNIFVWDYGINFDNYLAPFPNFHIMADNIRLFLKNHATMHFSQIAGSRGGDFAEMRTWFASQLMWNPSQDSEELIQEFLDGYYGEAAPYLYQYIKIMEGALIGSGQRLWIYDSPVSHKFGMLKPELMRRYNSLFDKAQEAVKGDRKLLDRVERARLPLLYSELEIARTNSDKDFDDLTAKLNYFEAQVTKFKVPTLNERSNSPLDYVKLFRERYMPRAEKSLAAGATITFETAPKGKYAEMSKTALCDELFGGSSFVESWVGWEGVDAAMVLDLGEVKSVNSVETDFLHQLGQWILLPKQVSYEVSVDGVNFTPAATIDLPENRSVQVLFKGVRHDFDQPEQVRYIRINVVGTKECPHWHYGVGHPCWFFVDEITVL